MLTQVTAWAEREPAVIGLVAFGSTAGTTRAPDEWSDHDLVVVTRDGTARAYRDDLSWLPSFNQIALSWQETEHAWCVLYDDGHLMEVAVFDDSEVEALDVNAFRVLVDRAELERRLSAMAVRTTARVAAADVDGSTRLGHLVTELVVGLSRHGRGERLSAHNRIRAHALPLLLSLVADFLPAEAPATLDELDPHRRFELAYPGRAAALLAAMERPLAESADIMLGVIESDLAALVPAATPEVLAAVRAVAARAVAVVGPHGQSTSSRA